MLTCSYELRICILNTREKYIPVVNSTYYGYVLIGFLFSSNLEKLQTESKRLNVTEQMEYVSNQSQTVFIHRTLTTCS